MEVDEQMIKFRKLSSKSKTFGLMTSQMEQFENITNQDYDHRSRVAAVQRWRISLRLWRSWRPEY